MPIYWSSHQIPQLAKHSPAERAAIVQLALQRLKPPQKLVLNLAKLLVLIPPFIWAARLGNWQSVLILLLTALLYPLITRPISLVLASPHLDQALQQWQRQQRP